MSETVRSDNPPISVYIRTKNEARLIAKVVSSALQIGREVVVVDSGSTDGTIDLAKAAGARVIEHSWSGNGHQKRFAEEQCQFDWLLDLDGDEIMPQKLADEIRGLFAHGEPSCSVYKTPMAIVPPVGSPWLSFGLQRRTKLYDRRKIRMPEHMYWDQFEIPPGTPVGKLTEPLLHSAVGDAHHLMNKLNQHSTQRANIESTRSTFVIIIRIILGLPVYFLKRYLFEGLFRGGVYGFAYALMTAFRRWLVDVKMYEKRKSHDPSINHDQAIDEDETTLTKSADVSAGLPRDPKV
ncbi:MAG: glycosyltransferase family 2 protein [Pseudomonadota bacterium]